MVSWMMISFRKNHAGDNLTTAIIKKVDITAFEVYAIMIQLHSIVCKYECK